MAKAGHDFVCIVKNRHVLETSVMEREFVEQLHELNHKISFVKEQSFKDARSCLDVKDVLDKLKIKVISLSVLVIIIIIIIIVFSFHGS